MPLHSSGKTGRGALTCTRLDHLDDGDDLLRESWSSDIGDHELALLDVLRLVADCLSSPLHCDPSMAAHRTCKLDVGHASVGHSGNDRRSARLAVLSNLAIFMPKLHATSGGRYGAFLFATYALVLGVAEVVTLRATP